MQTTESYVRQGADLLNCRSFLLKKCHVIDVIGSSSHHEWGLENKGLKKYAQGSQHLGGADVENGYMLKKSASHLMGSRIKKSAYNLIPH